MAIMAIYHFSAKVISRAGGASALASAAYRSASRLRDERLGRTHDFTNKQDVVHSEVLLPEGANEEWRDREKLWNDVEAAELRKDAQLSREIEFAIPREMTQAQGIELAREFVQAEFVDRGMVADLNVHWDIGEDGLAKPHAHVMLTTREVKVDENGDIGFGAKVRDWNRTELLNGWREAWATHVNERLAELDIDARVDHRSLESQGIDLEPQHKIGAPGQRMEAQGLESERAEDHLRIARENGEKILTDPGIALDAITHQQATFTHRDLAMFVHRHSEGMDQFNAVMSAVKASPDLVELGQDFNGQDRFTSKDMIETEERLRRSVEMLAQRDRHHVSEDTRDAALARAVEQRSLTLSGEQADALSHVTGPNDLGVVIGTAGSGKSAMLGVAREAWEEAGYTVQGAALSGIAAENLESGSGIGSRTIASLEHGWNQGRDLLSHNDVLVIDEAGMVGTRQLERVAAHVAEAGAKLVLVGDPQQLQSIEAGAAFRSIHEAHGGVEITEIRRQREDWQRQATRDLATGQSDNAIGAYDDHGHVHAAETREAARKELIDDWDARRQADPDGSRIILTHTNAEVGELNQAARGRLREAGQLSDDVAITVERGEREFASGDRIMFLKNERSLDVKNGTLGTIEAINEQSMTARLDDGRAVAFDLKDYAHVDHGYAATIHKAQGMTVDRVHVLATPGLDAHASYVALSRHRDSVDLHYGKDDFADREELTARLGRDRAKDMASDYARPMASAPGMDMGTGETAGVAAGPDSAQPEVQRDPAREFAERRGITFREKVTEIVRKVERVLDRWTTPAKPDAQQERAAEPAPSRERSPFDDLKLSVPKTEPPHTPAAPPPAREPELPNGRFDGLSLHVKPMGSGRPPLDRAVERYAKALQDAQRMHQQGHERLPHQDQALRQGREGLDALRPDGAQDLRAAFNRNDGALAEAASGQTTRAISLMVAEAEIRIGGNQRADDFVSDWKKGIKQLRSAEKAGNYDAAWRAREGLNGMAKGFERDPQLESLLQNRKAELGLKASYGESLSQELQRSLDVSRQIGLGL